MIWIILYLIVGFIIAMLWRLMDKGGHHKISGDILITLFWPVILLLHVIA